MRGSSRQLWSLSPLSTASSLSPTFCWSTWTLTASSRGSFKAATSFSTSVAGEAGEAETETETTKGKENEKFFDVVIVGGGMIGSALACGLKKASLTSELNVAVVDRLPPAHSNDKSKKAQKGSSVPFPDLRVSTLTPSTLGFLRRVGLGETVVAPGKSAAFQHMQIWDAFGEGYVRFSAQQRGRGGRGEVEQTQTLGHVIENEVLKQHLQDRARSLGCEFIYGDVSEISLPRPEVGITKQVTKRERASERHEGKDVGLSTRREEEDEEEIARVFLDQGLTVRTPLVIGADGGNSFVAKKAGIRSASYNYGQRAVTCTVRTRTENSTAFQRFLSTGPLALLPVRDGFSNVVWSTTVSQAEHLESLSARDFARAVNLALNEEPKGRSSGSFQWSSLGSQMSSVVHHLTGKSLGNDNGSDNGSGYGYGGGLKAEGQGDDRFISPPEVVEVVGTSQKSFPLKMKHALTYCHKSVALIGDAAHSIHPLAGQGVNIGFGDVEVLVETLQEALWSGQNYSDLLTLEKYSNKRHRANTAMIRTLDTVKAVYQSQFMPLAVARNMGMGVLNNAGVLKDLVVGYASSNASASKIIKGSRSKSTR